MVDEIVYGLMKKHLKTLPDPGKCRETEIPWSYVGKTSQIPFTARMIEIPNNTRKSEPTPQVFSIDGDKTPRNISTMDLYFITRLKKE